MASYSDTELQEIAGWLQDGLSAATIAASFSALRGVRVSRNAIIGIVHRNAMLGAIGFAHGGPAAARLAAGERSKCGIGMPAKGGATATPRRPPRLLVRGVLIADGEAYRLEAPVPQRTPLGRQPHGVAMRFIDCLFGRCRAPLDLTLEEDPQNDGPGGRPGADMLCCGMRTGALRSYCTYHHARFRRRIVVAEAG